MEEASMSRTRVVTTQTGRPSGLQVVERNDRPWDGQRPKRGPTKSAQRRQAKQQESGGGSAYAKKKRRSP
jgi:hypothetical protein